MKARVLLQPLLNVVMRMRTIVVHDQMQGSILRGVTVELAEELQKLFVAMTRVAGSNDCSIQHIECGEEAGGSITFIVMSHCATTTLAQRKRALCSVKSLDLAFLVT